MDFNWEDVDLNTVLTSALKVVLILAVVFVVLFIAKRLIRRIVTARIHRVREESPDQLKNRTDTLSQVIIQVVSFFAWVIAFIMILDLFGVNIGPLIAAIGVAGLAIGFAAQSIIRDYLNGFFIVLEDWYRINEVATVAATTGVVVDFNLRRTTLRDIDGTMHVIPNNKIDMVSNRAREWSRINLNIGIAYKENVNQVWKLLDEICLEFKEDEVWGQDMVTTPAVTRVDSLGNSAVELKILGDTKPGRQWALMGELRKRVKNRFDEEGIEIPWPHTKVYFGDKPPE